MKNLLSSTTKLFKQKEHNRLSVFGFGQKVDWEILFSLFLIAVLIMVLINVQIFLQIRSGNFGAVDTTVPTGTVTIDRTKLQNTLAIFQQKSATLFALQQKEPTLVDPSQ